MRSPELQDKIDEMDRLKHRYNVAYAMNDVVEQDLLMAESKVLSKQIADLFDQEEGD